MIEDVVPPRTLSRGEGDERSLASLDRLAQEALASYALPATCRLVRVNVAENVTYRVECQGDSVSVLRCYRHGYNSLEEIESELDWLEALRAEEIVRVPGIHRATTGGRVVGLHGDGGPVRHFAMFEYLHGASPTRDQVVRRLAELGRTAARLHCHGRSWRRPPRFVRRTWDVEAVIGRAPVWGSWRHGPGVGAPEERLLARVEVTIHQELTDYGTGEDRFGLIHADLRGANLLLDGAGIAVIDFDDCGFGWHLFDLATMLVDVLGSGDDDELWHRCLSGYREVAELPSDWRVLESFVMLRRLMTLAWLGSRQRVERASRGSIDELCATAEGYLAARK